MLHFILLFIYALSGTCATISNGDYALNAQQSFATFDYIENDCAESTDVKITSLKNPYSLLFCLDDEEFSPRTLTILRQGVERSNKPLALIQVVLTPYNDIHICTLSVRSYNEQSVLENYANMNFITEAADLACMDPPQVALSDTSPNCATLTYHLPKCINGYSHSMHISAFLPMLPRFTFSVESTFDGISNSQCRLAYDKDATTPRSIALDTEVLNAQHRYTKFDYMESEDVEWHAVKILSLTNSSTLTFHSDDAVFSSRPITIFRKTPDQSRPKPIAFIAVNLTPCDDPDIRKLCNDPHICKLSVQSHNDQPVHPYLRALRDDPYIGKLSNDQSILGNYAGTTFITEADDMHLRALCNDPYIGKLSVPSKNVQSVLGNYAGMTFITEADNLCCMDLPQVSGVYPDCTTLTYNLPKGTNGYSHTLNISTLATMLPRFLLSLNRQSDGKTENQFMLAYDTDATTPKSIAFDTTVLNATQPFATFDYVDKEITETHLLKISSLKNASSLTFHLDQGKGYPRKIVIFRKPARNPLAQVLVDLAPCEEGYLCSVSLQQYNEQSMFEDYANIEFITNEGDLACMYPPQVDINKASRNFTTLTYNLPENVEGVSLSIVISTLLEHLPVFMLSIKARNGTEKPQSLWSFTYDKDQRTPKAV